MKIAGIFLFNSSFIQLAYIKRVLLSVKMPQNNV